MITTGVKNESIAVGKDAQVINVLVDRDVLRVITLWAERNSEELDADLAPFGLHSTDILQPEYRRVLTREELAALIA